MGEKNICIIIKKIFYVSQDEEVKENFVCISDRESGPAEC